MTEAVSSVLVTKKSVLLHEMAAKARATYKQTGKKYFSHSNQVFVVIVYKYVPEPSKRLREKVKNFLHHSDNKRVAIVDNYL